MPFHFNTACLPVFLFIIPLIHIHMRIRRLHAFEDILCIPSLQGADPDACMDRIRFPGSSGRLCQQGIEILGKCTDTVRFPGDQDRGELISSESGAHLSFFDTVPQGIRQHPKGEVPLGMTVDIIDQLQIVHIDARYADADLRPGFSFIYSQKLRKSVLKSPPVIETGQRIRLRQFLDIRILRDLLLCISSADDSALV